MIPYVRRKMILSEIKKKELVYFEELLKKVENISESTLRRDLKVLEKEGYVDLLRGSAVKIRTSSYDMPLQAKERLHAKEKERIAKHAAYLVEDGEVIYLDSGTTILHMVKYLKDKHIKVITSNIQIVNILQGCSFYCILLGGEISISLGSVSGPITDKLLSELFFDKSFLGASGYTVEGGINTPDLREANKKRLAMEHSQQTFVLVDGSKAGKQTLCKAFDIDDCIIITDEPNEILEKHAKFIVVPELIT